jgi:hypothetical protein
MGKPGTGNAVSPRAEYIGAREASEGTETSQYLEERKSTETPRVVASESGPAQTGYVQACRRCVSGVVGRASQGCIPGRESQNHLLAEDPWNTGATAGNSPVGESGWSPEPVPE